MKEEQKIQKSSFWANLFKTTASIGDLYDIFKNIALFKNLGKNHFKQLYGLLHNRSYKLNEYVFHQGDPGNALYIIIEGSIKIPVLNVDLAGTNVSRCLYSELSTYERIKLIYPWKSMFCNPVLWKLRLNTLNVLYSLL